MSKALIFLSDIVGYSKLKNHEQHEAVLSLWGSILVDDLIQSELSRRGHPRRKLRFSGTGDGVYVVLWDHEEDDPHKFYQFARRVIERFSSDGRELKVVLHEGYASTIPIRYSDFTIAGEDSGSDQIVGSGPNDCRRVIDFADGGQVVLTESFIRTWKSAPDPEALPERLMPPANQPPVLLNVKHNVSLGVYFDSARPSVALEKTMALAGSISREMETALLPMVRNGLQSERGEDLDIRLSIFVPITQDRQLILVCTGFRVASDPAADLAQSATKYPIRQSLQGWADASKAASRSSFATSQTPLRTRPLTKRLSPTRGKSRATRSTDGTARLRPTYRSLYSSAIRHSSLQGSCASTSWILCRTCQRRS